MSNTRGPKIGYVNVGASTGVTVTADSTASGYDPVNVFDWKPFTFWTPASVGTHYITVTPAASATCDYFAMAQHNLGTNGATVKLQYSNDGGATWFDAFAAISPTGTECIWKSFDAIAATKWRVQVVSNPASTIGVISFGTAYQPGLGTIDQFMPPLMARKTTQYVNNSEAGLFLGRSILRRMLATSIEFQHLTPTQAYGEWLPFMKSAEKYPFFLAWLSEDYPTDVALMEADGDIPMPYFDRPGRLTVSIKMKGLVPS